MEEGEGLWSEFVEAIFGAEGGERFGISAVLSFDGLTVAVGGGGHNGKRGVVRIYGYNGVWWAQRGADLIGDETSDQLGWVLGMSSDGETVTMGAPGAENNYSRVYMWHSPTLSSRRRGGDARISDRLGSLTLSGTGDVLAIGSTYGFLVEIHMWNGAGWARIDVLRGAHSSGFRTSVALPKSGDTVSVGAPTEGGSEECRGSVSNQLIFLPNRKIIIFKMMRLR